MMNIIIYLAILLGLSAGHEPKLWMVVAIGFCVLFIDLEEILKILKKERP